ncbi:TRAP transporter small permease [Pseudomonas sp. F1_0610]|uniref:TRAP transporter small permease n=1 Tax=Pseudomonas sp. F1_0610 TaxID=3114284 RepID=UPI0039C47CED
MSSPKSRPESWLAIIALAGIAIISLGNVMVRYFTNASFAYTEEFSVFFLVVLTFAGAAVAARTNEHIRITVLEDRLPASGRRALYVLQWLGSLAVLGLIIWYGSLVVYEAYEWEEQSPGGYPIWIYQIWLPILALMIAFRTTQNLICRWKNADTREDAQ